MSPSFVASVLVRVAYGLSHQQYTAVRSNAFDVLISDARQGNRRFPCASVTQVTRLCDKSLLRAISLRDEDIVFLRTKL